MRVRLSALGRLTAVTGVATAFLGIWLHAFDTRVGEFSFGISYWSLDGTFGSTLLALASAGALIAALSLVTDRFGPDLALAIVGGTLAGLYLFIPAVSAFGPAWETLSTGAWLGVCNTLIVIGACTAASGRTRSVLSPRSAVLPAVGWALVMSGIWLDAERGAGSYWHPPGGAHWLGALFLFLLAAWAALTVLDALGRPSFALVAATGVAFTAFGLAAAVPVINAFNRLGSLREGVWLPLAGGLLLAAGTAAALRRSGG